MKRYPDVLTVQNGYYKHLRMRITSREHAMQNCPLLSHLQAKHPEQYKRLTDSTDSSSSKQTTLTGVLRKCSAQRASTITDLIAEFVARHLRPLSVVDGDGFKQLMGYIEPGYKVPSRTHVTSICRKKYNKKNVSLLC